MIRMTSSPVDCHKIYVATRLPYQRVTLRFRRGIIYTMLGTIVLAGLRKGRSPVASLLMVTLRSSDAVSGSSRTSVQWY